MTSSRVKSVAAVGCTHFGTTQTIAVEFNILDGTVPFDTIWLQCDASQSLSATQVWPMRNPDVHCPEYATNVSLPSC